MDRQLELYIQLKLNNKIIIPLRPSHSWTKNHWVWIFCIFSAVTLNDASLSMKDVDGNTHNPDEVPDMDNQTTYGGLAAAADATRGIVVGTGTTAEDFDDYILAAQIAHGTGAGQLSYGLTGNPAFGGDKTITWARSFTNGSGSTINVAETGLIFRTYQWDTACQDYFLVARDVLDSVVAVANGQILEVLYLLSVTFP